MGKIRPYRPRDKRRNNPRAEAMYALYCSGKSLSEVGKAFSVTRQTVYDMFRRRHYSLRSRAFLPTVVYNGETYSPDGHGYYRKTNGDRRLLHQVVWEDNYGPIPPGHDIHHKDGDKINNDPSNLACLTPSDHTRHHQPLQPTVEKRCLFCGEVLVRRRNADGTLEVPAALAKRSYCDLQCAGNHRRGKPRGWSPRHE